MNIKTLFKKKRSLKGGVEGISRGVVFGWAVSPSGQPVTLQLLINEVIVGTVQPTISRPDIAIASSVGYLCGFRFDLKPYLSKLEGNPLDIRDQATGEALPSMPIALSDTAGWGAVDGVFGLEVKGWAVWADLTAEPTPIEIFIDGVLAGCTFTDSPRPDLKKVGMPHLKSGFCFVIPSRWHDGEQHIVTAQIKGANREIRGSGVDFKCRIKSHIDTFTSQRVSGWIINTGAPECPVSFDLWVNGVCVKQCLTPNFQRQDVEAVVLGSKVGGYLLGFDFPLPQHLKWSEHANSMALCLPKTQENLLKNDVVAISRFDVIEHLEQFASKLLVESHGDVIANESVALNYAMRAMRSQFMSQFMLSLRNSSFDQPIIIQPQINKHAAGVCSEASTIDVIIPVYKGYEETLDCIHSVLNARDDTPMEIVVINDRSPDEKLSAELRKLAARGGFTLIENENNLGFVATVNKGMKLHSDHDVLLLNSDTIVPKGWLKTMQMAAYAEPNIGTVTPLSNRATIFSLPRTCFDNDMPLGMTVEQMNALCAERNPRVIVDVPTAVGFCMYIRRETLNEVGLFDETRWAKGYCEENDFCIRATGMGWRNIAACDVFVQHHGSVSFDTEKAPRVAENLEKLHAIYPDYPERIKRYIKADPIAAPRGRINMALLKQLASSYILFITHGLGGGTETAIRNLCKIHSGNGKNVLILRSTPSGQLRLAPAIAPHEKVLVTEYPHETDTSLLAEHLRELNIEYVHFHHTLGFKPDIWKLPEALGVPYDVMIHDFYLACPRINLIDDTGIYCGQPEIAACERCVKNFPLDHDVEDRLREVGGTVVQWRAFHTAQLQGARQIVAPSHNARSHTQKYLSVLNIDAVPHPEPAFSFKQMKWDGRLPHRVAVLGAIGKHKGSELLLACAKYALRENLPIHFVIIGYTDLDSAFEGLDNVEITGPYKPAELQGIVYQATLYFTYFEGLEIWCQERLQCCEMDSLGLR